MWEKETFIHTKVKKPNTKGSYFLLTLQESPIIIGRTRV